MFTLPLPCLIGLVFSVTWVSTGRIVPTLHVQGRFAIMMNSQTSRLYEKISLTFGVIMNCSQLVCLNICLLFAFQSCVHSCQAGYVHTDNDTYVQDVSKLPCTLENPGETNGICDGFGHSQCAPPFIGKLALLP